MPCDWVDDMSQARCTLKVEGLDCPTESEELRAALQGWPGVGDLGFDLIHGTLSLEYDPDAVSPLGLIERVVTRTGMRAALVGQSESLGQPGWWGRNRRGVAVAGSGLALLLGIVASWLRVPMGSARIAYALAIAIGGIELFPNGLRALRQARMDIHVLMSLAVLGALALGQWDEAATVAFLFGLSEALEAFSLDRARRAVRTLLEVAPETAEVMAPDGSVRLVPASQVRSGDRVHVRAGEKVPIDGKVLAGRSSVIQQAITGESLPVLREPGDPVYAGTVNVEGALEVEAAGPVGDALISRIIASVREAQAGRAPVERRINQFARVYTPAVVALALAVMIVPPLAVPLSGGPADWTGWFARGLVLLVIACPCALVIATPVAVVSALAAAARRGILVKGGQFLEEFGRLRALAFDKTGTLTRGEPNVIEVVSVSGRKDADLLRIAAALGDRGGHVLGRAIARHARGLRLEVPVADNYTAFPGLGATGRVEAVDYHMGSHRYIDEAGLCPPDFHQTLGRAEHHVGTSVALSTPSGPLGWIRLADSPRPEAAGVLAELSALGIQTIMLTGDNHRTAAAMARELGIREQRADLLPEDKVAAISALSMRHGPTGMVGDGVNDAPALAAARVSVAMGGMASGAALETADIILMADDLSGLPWLVRHSRLTLSLIHQNIALALATKAVVLALAIFGYAGLWMAIAADVGTTLVVIANALRLLPARRLAGGFLAETQRGNAETQRPNL